MAALLPIAVGFLIWLHWIERGYSWRRAMIYAALSWGTLIVCVTELLSAAAKLAFLPVIVVWSTSLSLLAAAYLARAIRKTRARSLRGAMAESSRQWLRYLAVAWNWRRSLPWGYAAGLATLIVIIGLTALLSPPNTFDSLTYHLPRVMHWVAQQSVRHFPTANDRQLWSPPWSEFVIAQFQILSGGDNFAGLVQFGSMLVGIVAVSLIAGELGAPSGFQFLAALIAATIPMGVLQASSTQTDWNVACWIVCLNLCVFDLCKAADRTPAHSERLSLVAAGIALGLAWLTKGTAIFFCVPCGVWLAVSLFRRLRWAAIPRLAFVLLLGLTFNAAHFARNLEQFGTPLSPAGPRSWLGNQSFDPRFVVSNLLRGAALHFHTRSRLLDEVLLIKPITRIHDWLGIDVNDPRSTYMGMPFDIPKLSTDEDYAGNPLHFLLLLVALALLGATALRTRDAVLGSYLACVLGMAVLFAAALKWQIWGSRLQFPIFVCGAPLIAVLFWQRISERAAATWAAGLLLFAVPFLLYGSPRSWAGKSSLLKTSREALYFQKIPGATDAYLEAMQRIRSAGYQDVGLIADYNAAEYELWAGLNPSGTGATQLRHVAPFDPACSDWKWPSPAPPDVVLTTQPTGSPQFSLGGRSYRRTWSRGDLELFEPVDALPHAPLASLGKAGISAR